MIAIVVSMNVLIYRHDHIEITATGHPVLRRLFSTFMAARSKFLKNMKNGDTVPDIAHDRDIDDPAEINWLLKDSLKPPVIG